MNSHDSSEGNSIKLESNQDIEMNGNSDSFQSSWPEVLNNLRQIREDERNVLAKLELYGDIRSSNDVHQSTVEDLELLWLATEEAQQTSNSAMETLLALVDRVHKLKTEHVQLVQDARNDQAEAAHAKLEACRVQVCSMLCVKGLQRDLDRYQLENLDLYQNIDDIKDRHQVEIDAAQDQQRRTNYELDISQTELNRYTSSTQDLNRHLEEAAEQLRNERAMKASLQQQLSDEQARLVESQAYGKRMEEKVAKMESESRQMAIDLTVQQERTEHLRSREKDLEQDLAREKDRVDRLLVSVESLRISQGVGKTHHSPLENQTSSSTVNEHDNQSQTRT